ncbi:hypothetical protein [Ancylobacter terrae]
MREGFQAGIIKDLTRAIALPTPDGSNTEFLVERDFRHAGVSIMSNR